MFIAPKKKYFFKYMLETSISGKHNVCAFPYTEFGFRSNPSVSNSFLHSCDLTSQLCDS